MLYKNDEPYKLAATEIKALEDYFHNKFPVKVVYPADRVVKSRSPHNRLPDKPASITFPLRSTVKNDKGSELWRYAENIIIDNVGRKTYVPTDFMFEGERFIDRADIELIYFLLKKSEYRFKSEEDLQDKGEKQSPRPKFMFQDLVSDAEKRVEKKKIQQKVDALIFGDMAFPEDKLREVLGAYFVPNVNELAFSQVRMALNDKVWSTKDGPTKFFNMVNADDELEARTSIQKVIDMKLLECSGPGKTWYWKAVGGKDQKVFTVPPNKDNATEALYEYYKGNEEFREDVKAVLISKKTPVKEKVTN
jgi:hypothetical protein